jgi:hypothetical protein
VRAPKAGAGNQTSRTVDPAIVAIP